MKEEKIIYKNTLKVRNKISQYFKMYSPPPQKKREDINYALKNAVYEKDFCSADGKGRRMNVILIGENQEYWK